MIISPLREYRNLVFDAYSTSILQVKANVRLRFGFGSTDDADAMCEDHGDFVEARWDELGPSVIEEGYKIGMASDFWNRYEEDIQLAKGLGVMNDASSIACRFFQTLSR